MKTIDQTPTNLDGNKHGWVLAFNRLLREWRIVKFSDVNDRYWPVWQRLPGDPEFDDLPAPTHPNVNRPPVAAAEPETA